MIPSLGEIPLLIPTIKTKAACISAKTVRNLTKYSMSAFKVLDVLPTTPLELHRRWDAAKYNGIKMMSKKGVCQVRVGVDESL